MAHIREYDVKRGKRWQVMFRVDGRLVSETFTDGQAAAEFSGLVDRIGGKAAKEVRAQRVGSPSEGKVPTVAQALADHIENLSGITIGTRRDYEKIAQQFAKSNLGPLPVDVVTKDAVRKWVNSQKVSAKTVRNRHALLYAAMGRQVEHKVIPANPCEGIRIGHTETTEMTILSWQEFLAVRAHLDEHWHPLATTLIGTGTRFSEATALQKRDFDLTADPPVVRISRSWKHTDSAERLLGAPKTQRGRRTISLGPEIVEQVAPLLKQRGRDDFVFVNKCGDPVRQNSFHEIWTRALDDADIGKRPRLHDLRHSFASWMLTQGVSLSLLQRMLGHEDIRTTVNVYGHLADDAMSVAAQAITMAMSTPAELGPAPDGETDGEDDQPDGDEA